MELLSLLINALPKGKSTISISSPKTQDHFHATFKRTQKVHVSKNELEGLLSLYPSWHWDYTFTPGNRIFVHATPRKYWRADGLRFCPWGNKSFKWLPIYPSLVSVRKSLRPEDAMHFFCLHTLPFFIYNSLFPPFHSSSGYVAGNNGLPFNFCPLSLAVLQPKDSPPEGIISQFGEALGFPKWTLLCTDKQQ